MDTLGIEGERFGHVLRGKKKKTISENAALLEHPEAAGGIGNIFCPRGNLSGFSLPPPRPPPPPKNAREIFTKVSR